MVACNELPRASKGLEGIAVFLRIGSRDAGIAASFRCITLNEAQKARAAAIQMDYSRKMRDIFPQKLPMMVAVQKLSAGAGHRNAEFRGLFTNDADRSRFHESAAQFPVPTVTLDQVVQSTLTIATQPSELDAARREKALSIIRKSVIDENSLYERDPAATERALIVAERQASVRALLTTEERAKVDAVIEMIKRRP